ncbi:glutathione S-transferase family protein [Bradyrhizobium sp. WYCCWR 12699]|uniref:glutathione S-transferase family protein n=1 Tax=Bradyrhizobium sp. WYCCWR 12699 TaxID=3064203 RepID=UPI0028A3450E|nr:glutathione S-transferase family protein [Bradyrhizobium sp. WYCCWR 12699]MDT4737242.1 glutathione S-transferase family protein [Bradyrhizobium sp. WYCCWR 12699]
MSAPVVYGFPRSTFVNIVRLVLTHKGIAYSFQDLEPVMGKAEHLALHPFNSVPIFRHDEFIVYETGAIVSYVDETFDGARLTPKDPRARARMNQWIGVVHSYVYPYMIYHVTHERLVFPELGIPSDEKVVAHALPKVETVLAVLERELVDGRQYLIGSELSIADFFLLPSTFAFSLTEEGRRLYPKYPAFCRWRQRMESLPTTQKLRAILPPREPIQHAREWAKSHRPKY